MFYVFPIILFFIFFFMISTNKSRIRPLALPIIGHLHLIKQPLHQCLSRISAKNGTQVVFLSFGCRPVLVVSSASAAEECFTTNDVIFANRPSLLATKHFGYECSMLGVAPYGHHWRNLRRFTTLHALSSSRLLALSSFFSGEVHSLLSSVFIGSSSSPIVDVRSHLWEFTMNIMMVMIAGKKYSIKDSTASSANPNEGMRFRRMVEQVLEVSGGTVMEDFIPVMKWFCGMEKKMKKLGKEMDELLQELVDERRRSSQEIKEERIILIDVMLRLQESQPDEYSDKIIKGMIMTLMLAGKNTTALSIEWAMALLLNHPQTLEKLKSEIQQHIGHERRLVRDTDIPKLHHLNNVIKETLRLYPPAPLLIAHESSSPCTITGLHVPKNTILLVNAYAIHRDPKVWGSDSMEFKPERFEEEEDDGNSRGLKYMPFGYGRRRCPGEEMGMKVVALALASLIQCFEWERVGEEMVNLDEGHGLTLPMALPLHAKLKPCTQMLHVLSQLSNELTGN